MTTKYQEAAKIVNLALQGLVSQCLPGAKVIDLCEFGHTVIKTQSMKLFTKKVDGQEIVRGVAFPVCISVNDVVCNDSPLLSEERVRARHVFSECGFSFLLLLLLLLLLFERFEICRQRTSQQARSWVVRACLCCGESASLVWKSAEWLVRWLF